MLPKCYLVGGSTVVTQTVRKTGLFCLPQFHTFPHRWRISLAKHSPMTFTNVPENLITVGMQSRHWDSSVFNDAEEAGN